ncbi:hypothetical protein CR162_10405 [Pseudoroseomonas rhizosphaerae]|uniref:Uncharacterized protein n=1 Tax=Teichococcus rhizosphaerae TaxID=1335062 RepID=A0A2C7ACI9_9PROT|nr:hypothetical protein [Pseudoroseomonas rhizosphaerae]PHK95145.1 hypothetical protein CR162_10405 [Pseudoroseomonas rhizosphaerae]
MNEFETLKELVRQDKVQLGVHVRKMNVAGSPAYRPVETLAWPVGILLACSLAAWLTQNVHVGAAVLAAGMAWWLLKVQPRVKAAVFERTTELAFSDERLFDGLWAKGVLTLYAKLEDGSARAATRKDDWRAFTRALAALKG